MTPARPRAVRLGREAQTQASGPRFLTKEPTYLNLQTAVRKPETHFRRQEDHDEEDRKRRAPVRGSVPGCNGFHRKRQRYNLVCGANSFADNANGAGIRVDGQNLTVLNCYFHNNQDGILESNIAGSNIVIKNSEFYQNGVSNPKLRAGYGFTHNLYIGHCASLLFEYNFTHHANVRHLLKSRAAVNYIRYNRITGQNGTDSYESDLPNAGTSYVVCNDIQQGPNTGNSTILSYLEEGTNSNNPGLDLYVVNNTFVNQSGSGTFVVAASPAVPVLLENNIFYGAGTTTNQTNPNLVTNFSVLSNPSMFVDFNNYNYMLSSTAGSPPIDAATHPGNSSEGFSLVPVWQFVLETNSAGGNVECEQPRTTVNVIDIGAYEFGGGGTTTCM